MKKKYYGYTKANKPEEENEIDRLMKEQVDEAVKAVNLSMGHFNEVASGLLAKFGPDAELMFLSKIEAFATIVLDGIIEKKPEMCERIKFGRDVARQEMIEILKTT